MREIFAVGLGLITAFLVVLSAASAGGIRVDEAKAGVLLDAPDVSTTLLLSAHGNGQNLSN